MSAPPRRDDDAQLVDRLRAALEAEAGSSRLVDPDRVWSRVAAGVPARRRRRAVQRSVLAAGLGAVVVLGAVGAVTGLQALGDRTAPTPASTRVTDDATAVTVQELLPAPLRTPRTTSEQARTWVLPAGCAAPEPAADTVLTARDGAGTYGSVVDVTQVARFSDDDAATTAWRTLDEALAGCVAGRAGLSLVPLEGGLDGVELRTESAADDPAATTTAVVLAGDAVALFTTSAPAGAAGPSATVRDEVLSRARVFARTADTAGPTDSTDSTDSADAGRDGTGGRSS